MTTTPFTETLPRDDGPDYPSTPARLFPSVEGHAEGLDVLACLTEDGPLFHVGPAVLDREQVHALLNHAKHVLDAADNLSRRRGDELVVNTSTATVSVSHTTDDGGGQYPVVLEIKQESNVSLELSVDEAEELGTALARPGGVTITDVLHVANSLGTKPSVLFRAAGV